MRKRVFYFASITTDSLNQRAGTTLIISPATNKVIAVCRALNAAGVKAVIVSSYIPTAMRSRWRFRQIFRQRGVAFVQLFTLGSTYLNRLVSMLSYAIYAAAAVRPADKVLLYNYFLEYIPAAFVLWLCDNRAIIDIEDAPRKDDRSMRGLVNRLSFAVLSRLCASRCVTVSQTIGPMCGFRESLPIYGVSSYFRMLSAARTRRETLALLFGGAITQETGLDIFLACVFHLADEFSTLSVEFHITGRYDRSLFEKLKGEIEKRSSIRLFLWGALSSADYNSLLNSMDVGLCLKLPEHSIGQTTFPSKVIEYSSFGMLVCSTPVSDVPFIFDDTTAVILTPPTGEELANTIVMISQNREHYEEIASEGQRMTIERFSSVAVGRAARDFIFGTL